MGKLIKNHWARLVVLTAASYQVVATLEAYFWPKFFFDFATKNFDGAVKPVPILQSVSLFVALISLAYEYPLRYVAGTSLQRSMIARMIWIPLAALVSIMLYQGTNAALYYMIGCGIYFWAYAEGEVICAVPWTLPKRAKPRPEFKA